MAVTKVPGRTRLSSHCPPWPDATLGLRCVLHDAIGP